MAADNDDVTSARVYWYLVTGYGRAFFVGMQPVDERNFSSVLTCLLSKSQIGIIHATRFITMQKQLLLQAACAGQLGLRYATLHGPQALRSKQNIFPRASPCNVKAKLHSLPNPIRPTLLSLLLGS